MKQIHGHNDHFSQSLLFTTMFTTGAGILLLWLSCSQPCVRLLSFCQLLAEGIKEEKEKEKKVFPFCAQKTPSWIGNVPSYTLPISTDHFLEIRAAQVLSSHLII